MFVVADLWANLMTGLNYPRFGVQGGDWGSWNQRATALRHPDRVVGLHLDYLSTRFRPAIGPNDPPASSAEQEYLSRVAKWADAEGAYMTIQGTKPLTLSYALTDSPAGLAAWHVEKFRSWSDCRAEPDEALTKDEMIMLPKELPMPPRSWAERALNVVHWSSLPRGGC